MSRGAVRREQIIDAALDAIRETPVADVQLAAIAERAGMRPAHVLYYFGSREGVLAAVAQRLAGTRPATTPAAYLPEDRGDPFWKLRIDGWLRSEELEEAPEWPRHVRFALDGLALHVLAGHLSPEEARELAQRLT